MRPRTCDRSVAQTPATALCRGPAPSLAPGAQGSLTAVAAAAAPLPAWPRFLRSSSFTGSFTRTPWYGRGGAGPCSGPAAVKGGVTGARRPCQGLPSAGLCSPELGLSAEAA